MNQNQANEKKREKAGRIFTGLLLVIALLATAIFMRNEASGELVQSIRAGIAGLPDRLRQNPAFERTPTPQIRAAQEERSAADPPTPSPDIPVETSPGILTVVTLTPTLGLPTTEPAPDVTQAAAPVQTQTPLAQSTVESLPQGEASPGSDAGSIREEFAAVTQAVEITRLMLQALSEEEMTKAERISLQAQLAVLDQEVEKLMERLNTASPPLPSPSLPSAPGMPEDSHAQLTQMLEMLEWMQAVLSQMEGMLQQMPE